LEQKSDRTLRFQILPSSCFLFWEWKNPRMLRKHTQPHHCQIWNLSMFAQNCQIWNLSMFTRLPLIPNPIVTYQIFQCLPNCQIWNLSMFARLPLTAYTESFNACGSAGYTESLNACRSAYAVVHQHDIHLSVPLFPATRQAKRAKPHCTPRATSTRQIYLGKISQLIQQEKMGETADRNQNRSMEKLWHLRSTQQISFCIQIPGLTLLKSKRQSSIHIGMG